MSTLLILGNFWIIKLINGKDFNFFIWSNHYYSLHNIFKRQSCSLSLNIFQQWGAHPIFCLSWMNVVVLGTQSPSHVQLFCDPMDCSLPGSSVHGISQARILEWVTISSSRGSSWPRDGTQVSCIGRRILYHWATREPLVQDWCICKFKSFSKRSVHSFIRILEGSWLKKFETVL